MGKPRLNEDEHVAFLIGLISKYTWEDFEKLTTGRLYVAKPGFGGVLVSLRVGLFMNRPTQALIAEGRFIRMRAAPDFGAYKLKKLDPAYPDTCLYPVNGLVQPKVMDWNPFPARPITARRVESKINKFIDKALRTNTSLVEKLRRKAQR